MAQVYSAWDTQLRRTVVLKLLSVDRNLDATARERLAMEAEIGARAKHENIVEIYDFGEDNTRSFLVMEFVEGSDLRTLIRDRSLDLGEKLRIALQIARALRAIHGLKPPIVHRDIKPSNVRITANRKVKLMDFGISKIVGLEYTSAGLVLGSAYYMSPEHVRGDRPTPAFDIYAFGILLYELFASVRPFKGDTIEEIFAATLNQPVDLKPLRDASTPEAMVTLIQQCTSKLTGGRPTADDVCGTLEALSEEPATKRSTLQPRIWISAGLVAALIMIIGLIVAIMRPNTTRTDLQITKTDNATPSANIHPQPPPLPATIKTDNGEMVLIPENASAKIPAFYMDRTEITVAEYNVFRRRQGRNARSDDETLPVGRVTFDEARDFAKWAGKRLPTLEEWRWAARGHTPRKYPWGDEEDASLANLRNPSRVRSPSPVPPGTFPKDVSAYGIGDMGGNVSEFVVASTVPKDRNVKSFDFLRPPATAGERWVTIAGGSFETPLESAAIEEWGIVPARYSSPAIGFRCVKDAR